MTDAPIRILFVCLGNICRSPLAEGVFRHLARQGGVEDRFEIDSAGTAGYHVGDPPDARSVATARARGVEVGGQGRQLAERDLLHYDYVIAMDSENLADVRRLAGRRGGTARIHLLRDWDLEGKGGDVPDPYYGGPHGFEKVHDIVERSCARLLEDLTSGFAGP